MRKPIVAGNWKMNTTVGEAVALVQEMIDELDDVEGVDKVLCPPFVSLEAVSEELEGTSVRLGAQNVHWQEKGAYTGEISPAMLEDLCQYVIIGHSERRQFFGENDETVNKKVKAALAHNLIPIVCLGENLEQNEKGLTAQIVTSQTIAALDGLTAEQIKGSVVAYEPIWAIGTGRPATGKGANEVTNLIRRTVAEKFGPEAAAAIRIQYGGSVTAANAAEFFSEPDIDGALVGGASLKAVEFVSIVSQAAAAKRD
ncbi:MAG: triose-phosphate isomerase [Chloroflexi bacterium]|nr:triose-phosphate isomerase [Chloroflexota bacterium]